MRLPKKHIQMKRIVLIYGLIAGAITAIMLFVTAPLYDNGTLNFNNGQYVGYSTMIIALSMIFFGIKNYRDNHMSGFISFGKALAVGLLITLVAAVVYALAWEICLKTSAEGFMEKYAEQYVAHMESTGASAQELLEAKEEIAGWEEIYKSPVLRFAMTMVEILPVGIFFSLVFALVLRRKARI